MIKKDRWEKYFKLGRYELAALVLIGAGILLRLLLAAENWPITNSDEDTMGLMALHIAYHGEHPIFFYGQYYMGAFEAYVGAALFHLFGPSLFSLRLGLVLVIGLFLTSTYLLASMLYSRALGLVAVGVLALGSSFVFARQLSAIGGYPETLLFGSLAFLLASLLAITADRELPTGVRGWRLLSYACWGLVVGLGLWSDLLIIPFALCSGLLILLFCWRDLLRPLPLLSIILGLTLGAGPLISYNLRAAPGQDSLSTLIGLQHGGDELHYSASFIARELRGTVLVSIPMVTGNPFCPVTEISFLGPTSPHTLQCTLIRGVWGVGYLLLFACAFILALWGVWTSWRGWRAQAQTKQNLARSCARLLLLYSAGLALGLYAFSAAPVDWPGIHARYVIGLLIATPAVIWPLWKGLTALARPGRVLCGALLACIVVVLLAGTVMTFDELPAARADMQRQLTLANDLVSVAATHIYTDYWNCNRLAFLSQERVICAVVTDQLQPSHNRYERYYDIVSADPHSAYVFRPQDYTGALKKKITRQGARYRRYTFGEYVVYQPS